MLGNYLQMTTSADDISDAFFSWRFKVKYIHVLIFQKKEEIQRKVEQERLAKQRENARLKMERERRVRHQ